jgi:DNA-binding transcriptional regulator GbsR (MarR family)
MSHQTQLTVVPDYPMLGIELDGFYQTPNSMAIKAIRAKLTAADWSLWAYLQMIEPFGDRMVELPKIPEIAEAIGVSERQVKRSLAKLEDLELYRWEPVVIRGQNLAGKQAKELGRKKKANQSESRTKHSVKRKMTDLSEVGQDYPESDSAIKLSHERKMTDLSEVGQDYPESDSAIKLSHERKMTDLSEVGQDYPESDSAIKLSHERKMTDLSEVGQGCPESDSAIKLSHERKMTDLSEVGQDYPESDSAIKLPHERKMTDLSEIGQDCPNQDRFVQARTDLSKPGQICPNQDRFVQIRTDLSKSRAGTLTRQEF